MRVHQLARSRPTSPTYRRWLGHAKPLPRKGSPNLPNLPDLSRAYTCARNRRSPSCVLLKQVGQVGQVGQGICTNGFRCPNLGATLGASGQIDSMPSLNPLERGGEQRSIARQITRPSGAAGRTRAPRRSVQVGGSSRRFRNRGSPGARFSCGFLFRILVPIQSEVPIPGARCEIAPANTRRDGRASSCIRCSRLTTWRNEHLMREKFRVQLARARGSMRAAAIGCGQ